MKTIKNLILFSTLLFGITLFTSCNKNEPISQQIIENQDEFLSVLRKNMDNVGGISIGRLAKNSASGEFQTIYLDIQEITPEIVKMAENVGTLQDISELILYSDATLELTNEKANAEIQFDIPVREAQRSLSPMVAEAKQYLFSKGFSTQELQNMIAENGATEYDLVPLVIFLQENESQGLFANCATVAIGSDATFQNLSKTAIKETFEISTSRISGAISSAISVGNYMQCICEVADAIVENMVTSDEFVGLLEMQLLFTEKLLSDNDFNDSRIIDLQNIQTKEEMMLWLTNNISYTEFSSVSEASNMFDAIGNIAMLVGENYLPPKLQPLDALLLKERITLWIKDDPIPYTVNDCMGGYDSCMSAASRKLAERLLISGGLAVLGAHISAAAMAIIAVVDHQNDVNACTAAFLKCMGR